MTHRTNSIVMLLTCFSLTITNAGLINSAYAEQNNTKEKQQTTSNIIHGKVTEIIKASVYTYAEVDTGKNKVWAAGPVTPLKTGDMISFSKGMPMKNFHSKSMKRDFPVIYFVNSFKTTNMDSKNKITERALPHSHLKQKQAAKPVKGINKVKGGNTIAEINMGKQKLKGKTVRVRGKVTKFTPNVMGKNWLHIRDSSTLDDLTATSDSTVAIDDVVILEGKLELDKDYGYGYVYPVILEDAKITKN